MSLVRFTQNPWLDRFFDNNEIIDWNKNLSNANSTLPSVNVKEDENQFNIEVAAPGFDKKDFKIEVQNDVLSISSEKDNSVEEKEDNGHYTKREFSYQSFKRSFTLPESINAEKIDASYANGILNIVIPKKEEEKAKEPKLIEIK